MGDFKATHYPKGNLEIVYLEELNMSAINYRLAWYFEITSIDPYQHVGIWIDAKNGEFIREQNLDDYCNMVRGSFISRFNGYQLFDIKNRGNDFTLEDCDRNIVTKEDFGLFGFDLAPHVSNGTVNWGTNQRDLTSTHWATQQAWDYFSNVHGRQGPDGNYKKVKMIFDAGIPGSVKSNDKISIAPNENS